MPAVIPMPLPSEAGLVPCEYAQHVLDGDPREREYVYLTTPDGSYTVGVWEAQPYTERIDSYPGNEFCYVVRGQVTLTGSDGSAQTFAEGDTFTVQAGWAGEWRVDKPFMKYFALSVPSAGAQ
jgi:uncharacterized protein